MNRITLFLIFLGISFIVSGQEIIRGPYLQSNSSTSIIIKWRTDKSTQSIIWIGTKPDQLNRVFHENDNTKDHEVTISELVPSTKYYYAIGEIENTPTEADEQHYFTTSPNTGEPKPTKIWVLGDCGTGTSKQRRVRDAYYDFIGEEETDMILLLGDNAYTDGEDWEYQKAIFEDMYEDILTHAPVWSCPGNHELISADAKEEEGAYYDIFTFPENGEIGGIASGTENYYSFDYANIHIISLNSTKLANEPDDPMLLWLNEDLKATSQDWIITIFHHPPYTKGSHDSDDSGGSIDMRENVLPILEAGGVDLVLSGHSHCYERSYLLHGHYDYSNTLEPAMLLDDGDGRIDGDGSYQKTTEGNDKGKGAVYIVAGSSGKVSDGSFDHPVMYYSAKELGSLSLEINGDQLDLKFVNDLGEVSDYFSLQKSNLSLGSPPVIELALENDEPIAINDTVRLIAQATDIDGTVTKVAFYIDDEYVGTDYDAPYSWDWVPTKVGVYYINAEANDNDGQKTFSNKLSVIVAECIHLVATNDLNVDPLINVFPNPSKEDINFSTPLEYPMKSITFYDFMGHIVKRYFLDSHEIQINDLSLVNGIYIAEINFGNGQRKLTRIHIDKP